MDINGFCDKLENSVEGSMAQAFHRPLKHHGFVYSCVACKAFDIYGYQAGWQPFIKISLLNPAHIYKCADLLLSGSVFPGMPLQPYESHIPYLLAFLADYNLYGCDWLEFNENNERTGFEKTARSGREFDINVTSIANKLGVKYSSRHTQTFETQSDAIAISSLYEARLQDSEWRSHNQFRKWTGSGLQPQFQLAVKDWPWESRSEHKELLKKKLKDINEHSEERDFANLAKASDLVESCIDSLCSPPSEELNLSAESGNCVPSDCSSKETEQSFGESIKSSHSTHNTPPQGYLYCSNQYFQFRFPSPSTSDVGNTCGSTSQFPVYFSNIADVSDNLFTYGGQLFHKKSLNPKHLCPFTMSGDIFRLGIKGMRTQFAALEYTVPSPKTSSVIEWQAEQDSQKSKQPIPLSVGSGVSAGSYQMTNLDSVESPTDELSICVIELHIDTRPGKVPKASEDPISAVFWEMSGSGKGIITSKQLSSSKLSSVNSVIYVTSELQILEEVLAMVKLLNPDILSGYEVKANSWGYAHTRYSLLGHQGTFYSLLGRVEAASSEKWKQFVPENGKDNEVVPGRHLLSLWSILRHEVTLSKYTLEYVAYNCLRERVPHYSFDTLRNWWQSQDHNNHKLVVTYWESRVNLVLRIFAYFEIVSRTCEKSRLIGVDFLSTLTRGSQFQVESVLCRLSRKENFVLISPSKAQVGQQNALEFIPLVMEPISQFYADPVCVLDFRSLYPSIVIALNLCYSTCIGRVNLWNNRNKIGFKHDHPLQIDIMDKIGEENIYVAPNGIGYVNPRVRKSLLAQMLGEILDTRFMINDTRKSTIAKSKEGARFHRNLNSKQLALKFIANVTYGYTSASFSGRMPCSDLADSIVSAGREILEHCIRKIEQTHKWGIQPKVVYGDTDSLFVQLPQVTKEQAFRIGGEIADMITKDTPNPILLKLEKVYNPCILMTKKRYVGNCFESETQVVGELDAKGIETIRRDGTPIVQKIEKRSLQILFNTGDLSQLKNYLQTQWRRILNHDIRVQDFCFAQEVKLGHYKSNDMSSIPGGAVVSLKKMMKDDGVEPQYRERVPFIVTAGPQHSRINDRVVSPEELMASTDLRVDTEYYIEKVIIPPLDRLFSLVGVNVRDWYVHMPRMVRINPRNTSNGITSFNPSASGNLGNFVKNDSCSCCFQQRRLPYSVLCSQCSSAEPKARYILTARYNRNQSLSMAAQTTCRLCSSASQSVSMSSKRGQETQLGRHPCESIDCSVYYDRVKYDSDTVAALELLNQI